jgi:hypothetical protein
MKKIPEKYLKIGNQGVDFAQKYFEEKNISFIKTTKEEDIVTGVDCYIDNIPVDVKNTKDLYICQIHKNTSLVNVRHPYKNTSKATHFCFVQVSEKKQEFIEMIEIREKLLEYFDSEEKLNSFLAELQNLDQTPFIQHGVTLAQACYKIKMLLQSYLNSSSLISYIEPSAHIDEISFKLVKRKKLTSTDSAKEVLNKYKDKIKTTTVDKPIEEIIKIKI